MWKAATRAILHAGRGYAECSNNLVTTNVHEARQQHSQGWYTGRFPYALPEHFSEVKRGKWTLTFSRFHDSFMTPVHVYEARPRKDHRGDDLITDALPLI